MGRPKGRGPAVPRPPPCWYRSRADPVMNRPTLCGLLGLDGLTTGVETAVGAYPVRQLGLAALRARRIRGCLRPPVCPPHTHLAAALPPFGYCHRFLSFSPRRRRRRTSAPIQISALRGACRTL